MVYSFALVPMFLAGLCPADAATPAYYHPDDVAAASERFAEAARAIGPPFEEADAEASRYGTWMADLELGVALLGSSAPAGLGAWSTALRRDVTAQFLALQKHADAVQGAYSKAFGNAVERALPTVGAGRTVVECTGSGMLAMMHHTSCEGENLNASLARAIDNDPMLGDDLRELAVRSWPHITASGAPQTPVALTGVVRSIDLGEVAAALILPRLEARKDALEHALDPLQDGIAAHDATAMSEAGAAKQAYIAQLGEDGVVLRAAITAALQRAEKKGGPTAVAACPNPAGLGGCGVEDVTESVLDVLRADKKLVKELAALGG